MKLLTRNFREHIRRKETRASIDPTNLPRERFFFSEMRKYTSVCKKEILIFILKNMFNVYVCVCLLHASERVFFRTSYSDSHIFFVSADSDEKSIRENNVCSR